MNRLTSVLKPMLTVLKDLTQCMQVSGACTPQH